MEASGQIDAPAALPTPGERAPGTHWIGGWVDPRVDLDLYGRERNPGPPAYNLSLYRLSYPDFVAFSVATI
jgi:hypothetical protein